jgi:hypothetical protein
MIFGVAIYGGIGPLISATAKNGYLPLPWQIQQT